MPTTLSELWSAFFEERSISLCPTSLTSDYRQVGRWLDRCPIQDLNEAIDQIAKISLRNIVEKFQLDEILSESATINAEITKILDTYTETWGVVVNSVEINDIELPDTMQRTIAKQAEAECEKCAKIISAEGKFLSAKKLADTEDIMMAYPIAL